MSDHEDRLPGPEDHHDAAAGGHRQAADGSCGDAALYLLGLLDDDRAGAFLAHARDCAVCGDELAALAPAVDALPTMVPALPAPPQVKQRVMAAVADELAARSTTPAIAGVRPQRPLARLLRSRPLTRPRLAGALAALLLAVLAFGVGIGALTAGGGRASGARVISAQVTLAGAQAALHQSAGHAWLTVAGLPQPRAGHVYEVWLKRAGHLPQPTSSLFAPTAAGSGTVAVPGSLKGVTEVMVTQEPAGGSPLPTSAPVIVARVA